MLRDMEELLNLVLDLETKDYLREALNCYNSGSFKACVIMSVISGIYDLHKKVKVLASSNRAYQELDEEIEKRKKDLKPYEKYFIEQCGTERIDMLNANETKELQRCLDTRNDCAHPSDFICSPEKARDIYSSIIDIICSKPVLFGCNNLTRVVEELKEKTFFPVMEKEKIRKIVNDNISKFQEKAVSPLLNKISQTIITTEDSVQRENGIYFLAMSEKCINDYSENYLLSFLKEENEKYLLQLLGINQDLLNYFSDENVERIKRKFEINLESEKINNLENWVTVLLSERFKKDNLINEVINNLINEKNNSSIIFDILEKLLENVECDEVLKNKILSNLESKCTYLINEDTVIDSNFLEIIKIMDSTILYEEWLTTIISYFKSYSNFYMMNSLLEQSFKKIPENLWVQKVSKEIKINFVSCMLDEGNTSKQYCSSSARELIENFRSEYPILVSEFIDELMKKDDSKYFGLDYQDTIISYISDETKKNEYNKKLERK